MKKYDLFCHKYVTGKKDKYLQLKSRISSWKKASEERGRVCVWRMRTITVTRHVDFGPEFKVCLPDDVSDCLIFCCPIKICMTKY